MKTQLAEETEKLNNLQNKIKECEASIETKNGEIEQTKLKLAAAESLVANKRGVKEKMTPEEGKRKI